MSTEIIDRLALAAMFDPREEIRTVILRGTDVPDPDSEPDHG